MMVPVSSSGRSAHTRTMAIENLALGLFVESGWCLEGREIGCDPKTLTKMDMQSLSEHQTRYFAKTDGDVRSKSITWTPVNRLGPRRLALRTRRRRADRTFGRIVVAVSREWYGAVSVQIFDLRTGAPGPRVDVTDGAMVWRFAGRGHKYRV